MTDKKFSPETHAQDGFQGANRMAPTATLGQRSFNGVIAMQPKPATPTNSGSSAESSNNATSHSQTNQTTKK